VGQYSKCEGEPIEGVRRENSRVQKLTRGNADITTKVVRSTSAKRKKCQDTKGKSSDGSKNGNGENTIEEAQFQKRKKNFREKRRGKMRTKIQNAQSV